MTTHYDGESYNNLKPKLALSMEKTTMDNFQFPIDTSDTIFVLTQNKSTYKENVGNLVSKMIIIKELKYVDLDSFTKLLGVMKIEELNIFSVNSKFNDKIRLITNNINPGIKYIEINWKSFVLFINHENTNFLNYNKDSLYIVRGGNYIDIKNLFAKVNNEEVNLGRWRKPKSPHAKPFRF